MCQIRRLHVIISFPDLAKRQDHTLAPNQLLPVVFHVMCYVMRKEGRSLYLKGCYVTGLARSV